MPQATNDQIDQLTSAIVARLDPVRVILFGSQAKGTADANSDIDLLVVDKDRFSATRSRRKLLGEVRRSLPRVGIPIDLLIFDEHEYEIWKDTTNHVIAEARQEGRVLHERCR